MINKNNFKVGTIFIITSKPSSWSIGVNEKCPLTSYIKYPYRGIITNISECKENGNIAMTEGKYGWSLSCLIRENKIITINEERKIKINKINERR